MRTTTYFFLLLSIRSISSSVLVLRCTAGERERERVNEITSFNVTRTNVNIYLYKLTFDAATDVTVSCQEEKELMTLVYRRIIIT